MLGPRSDGRHGRGPGRGRQPKARGPCRTQRRLPAARQRAPRHARPALRARQCAPPSPTSAERSATCAAAASSTFSDLLIWKGLLSRVQLLQHRIVPVAEVDRPRCASTMNPPDIRRLGRGPERQECGFVRSGLDLEARVSPLGELRPHSRFEHLLSCLGRSSSSQVRMAQGPRGLRQPSTRWYASSSPRPASVPTQSRPARAPPRSPRSGCSFGTPVA